jgi:hypothetical protein
MTALDPVSWETVEAATGPPALELGEHINRMIPAVRGDDPYDAVKTIHDAFAETEVAADVSTLADPFIIAYLLERRGVIVPDDTTSDYRSIVARRPDSARLEELFWRRERTLWWIGLLAGVHPTLVTYWFYEDGIPLMERKFSDESMERIRAVRGAGGR